MKLPKKSYTSELVFCVKVALVSSLVGMVTVLPFIIIYKWDLWAVLIRNFMIGFINGIIGSLILIYFIYRNIRLKPWWSFLVIFIYIALLCYGFGAFFGLANPILLIVIIAWAEFIGLFACYLFYRYSERLNERLRQTQERLQNLRKS